MLVGCSTGVDILRTLSLDNSRSTSCIAFEFFQHFSIFLFSTRIGQVTNVKIGATRAIQVRFLIWVERGRDISLDAKESVFGLRAFRRYVRTPRKIHCTISPRSFSSITPLTSWSPRVNCIGHCNKWHLSKLKESVVTRPAKQVSSVRVELKSE